MTQDRSQPRPSRRLMLATAGAAWLALGAQLLAPTPAAAQDLTKIKVSVDARIYGSNASIWFAQQGGFFKAEGIEATVDGSSGSGDAINRVASGAYDVAYADIGTLAEFWSRQPDAAPKLVMVILDRLPQAVVSVKKSGITTLKGLEGKKVGTGQSDATSRMFPAVLKINNIPLDSVTRVPVDQRMRDTMLIRGDVDAVIGFDSLILFNLMTQNIKPEDTNVLYYADNGYDFYGNGIVVSKALIEKNPALVSKITRAIAKAWIAGIKDPSAVIKPLAKADSVVDADLETQRLVWVNSHNVVTPATRAGGLGVVDMARMEKGLKTVAEGFSLATVPKPSDIYDDRFLPPLDDRRIPAQ